MAATSPRTRPLATDTNEEGRQQPPFTRNAQVYSRSPATTTTTAPAAPPPPPSRPTPPDRTVSPGARTGPPARGVQADSTVAAEPGAAGSKAQPVRRDGGAHPAPPTT